MISVDFSNKRRKAIVKPKNSTLMKKIFLTTVTMLLAIVGLQAANKNLNRATEQPFVFNEAGIEFAVFKDGQFDFNVIAPAVGVHIDTRYLDFSYNSGHNYDAFVQYDSYGAVIQVENTPIYYDYYGRVSQIGNIHLYYNSFGYVSQIGNMFVSYTPAGYYNGYRGYINNYNRRYVYQPRYKIYRRPVAARVVIHSSPYRKNFRPVRYKYTNYRKNYRNNRVVKTNFRRPGSKKVVVNNNNRRNVSNRVVTKTVVNKNVPNKRTTTNNRKGNKTVVTKTVVNKNNGKNYTPRNQKTTKVVTTKTTKTRGGNTKTTRVTTTKYNKSKKATKNSKSVASSENKTYRRR